jgi:hypothetical protein
MAKDAGRASAELEVASNQAAKHFSSVGQPSGADGLRINNS